MEKFADMAGLKKGGSASTVWGNVRRKINAVAATAGMNHGSKSASSGGTGDPSTQSETASTVSGINKSASTAASPPEKKKRVRKPKTDVDGETAPPRKRVKRETATVKNESKSSPMATDDTIPFNHPGTSFTPINGNGNTPTDVLIKELLGE